MTTSKSPVEQMLDLMVFAPLGMIITVTEELPSLVEKGRQRLTSQVTLARMMGEMAAPEIQKEAAKLVKGVIDLVMPAGPPAPGRATSAGPAPSAPPAPPAPTAPPAPSAPAHEARAAVSRSTSPNGSAGPARPSTDAAVAATLAIPGYDTLSAMQVVQRLTGLSPSELEAVRAYEALHRGRKTILNRADQLLSGTGG